MAKAANASWRLAGTPLSTAAGCSKPHCCCAALRFLDSSTISCKGRQSTCTQRIRWPVRSKVPQPVHNGVPGHEMRPKTKYPTAQLRQSQCMHRQPQPSPATTWTSHAPARSEPAQCGHPRQRYPPLPHSLQAKPRWRKWQQRRANANGCTFPGTHLPAATTMAFSCLDSRAACPPARKSVFRMCGADLLRFDQTTATHPCPGARALLLLFTCSGCKDLQSSYTAAAHLKAGCASETPTHAPRHRRDQLLPYRGRSQRYRSTRTASRPALPILVDAGV